MAKTQTQPETRPPTAWTPVVLGGLMVVLGILAMVAPQLSGRGVVVTVLGGLLAASGLAEAISSARGGPRAHRGLVLVGGVLALGVGIFLLVQPTLGMAALSLLIAGFFVAYGLFASITALGKRYEGWSWDFAFGVAALVLGAVTIAFWPGVALWLLATLVGVAMVARGASLMATGFGMHEPMRPSPR
jgi:uncharacterized membrane protein HdeD (DUF308 family)